jgi:hypothetical protein
MALRLPLLFALMVALQRVRQSAAAAFDIRKVASWPVTRSYKAITGRHMLYRCWAKDDMQILYANFGSLTRFECHDITVPRQIQTSSEDLYYMHCSSYQSRDVLRLEHFNAIRVTMHHLK